MNWLKKLFGFNPYFTGVRQDPRDELKKREDYAHEERLLAAGVGVATDPFGFEQIFSSPYPYENQRGVGSCVPHGVGLGLAIERASDIGHYARLAWLFIYRLRSNFPYAGAWMQEIFNLYRKYGAPLHGTLPTRPEETEASANAIKLTQQMYTEAEIYRGKEYYMVNKGVNDIIELAKIASAGHAVPIIIHGTYKEWAKEYPSIDKPNLDYADSEVRHCVAILPKSGFIKNGIRYVTIQDSAWFGGFKLRYLSEYFVRTRCVGAGYWDTVSVIATGERPKYTFTKVLKYGSTGPEVKAMQQLLIAEGLLPTDCQTGAFYGRTLAGVRAFQNKYAAEILLPLNLDAPTDTWGSRCIAKANALCA